jgi:hypothetical protein
MHVKNKAKSPRTTGRSQVGCHFGRSRGSGYSSSWWDDSTVGLNLLKARSNCSILSARELVSRAAVPVHQSVKRVAEGRLIQRTRAKLSRQNEGRRPLRSKKKIWRPHCSRGRHEDAISAATTTKQTRIFVVRRSAVVYIRAAIISQGRSQACATGVGPPLSALPWRPRWAHNATLGRLSRSLAAVIGLFRPHRKRCSCAKLLHSGVPQVALAAVPSGRAVIRSVLRYFVESAVRANRAHLWVCLGIDMNVPATDWSTGVAATAESNKCRDLGVRTGSRIGTEWGCRSVFSMPPPRSENHINSTVS